MKSGWCVELCFSVCLHVKDKAVLENLQQQSLRVGIIHRHGPETVEWRVRALKEIEKLIEHFSKFPLRTQKRADFELFKEAFNLIKNKEHLTVEG